MTVRTGPTPHGGGGAPLPRPTEQAGPIPPTTLVVGFLGGFCEWWSTQDAEERTPIHPTAKAVGFLVGVHIMQGVSKTPVEYVAEVTGPHVMAEGCEPYYLVVARVGQWGQGSGRIYLATEATIHANMRAIEDMISADKGRSCKPHHIDYRMGKPSRFADPPELP